MRCGWTRRWIPGYVTNELSPFVAWMVSRHIAACRSCAKEAESYHRLNAWIAVERLEALPRCDVKWESVQSRLTLTPKTKRFRWSAALVPIVPVAVGVAAFFVMHRYETPAPVVTTRFEVTPPPIAGNILPREPKPSVAPPTNAIDDQYNTTSQDVVKRAKRYQAARPSKAIHVEPNKLATEEKVAHLPAPPSVPHVTDAPTTEQDAMVTEINVKGDASDTNEARELNSHDIRWAY